MYKNMVSIIIPSRNEKFLSKTVEDIFLKAKGDVEVIVILDGPHSGTPLKENPNLHVIKLGTVRGMRMSINAGVAISRGKYIMKSDAHCMYEEGFDVKLKKDCKENWIAVPRRYTLNPEEWRPRRKSPVDYLYISSPEDQGYWGGLCIAGKKWRKKNSDIKLRKKLIDDLMSFQGSCYFMHKKYFYELDLLDDINYGASGKEALEVLLKCWLSGGRVIRNKKTWYAHLHKGRKYGRGFRVGRSHRLKSGNQINKWLIFGEAWDKQKHDFKWLVDKFDPPDWKKRDWDDESWKRSLIK